MPDTMTFQFLDVGMGDGTLVQIRVGRERYDRLVLVDFGEKRTQYKVPYEDAMEYLVDTINRNSDARRSAHPYVDLLVITHPDGDHYNKIAELVDADYDDFPGEQLHFGDVYFSGRTSEYGDLLDDTLDGLVAAGIDELVQDYHSPIARDGTVTPTLRFGDVRMYVLSANWPKTNGATNPKSIVLQFDVDGQAVILPGDATIATEDHIRDIFSDAFLRSRGMKLGHHGSKGSNSEEWIEAVEPDAIFGSADFAWSHPYCEAICRVLDANVLPDEFARANFYNCGDGGQYYNNPTRKVIGMNLWYTVLSHGIEDLIDTRGRRVLGFLHNTFGVQWAMWVVPRQAPQYGWTDVVWPAPRQRIDDPWDCDALARDARGLDARAFVALDPSEAVRALEQRRGEDDCECAPPRGVAATTTVGG